MHPAILPRSPQLCQNGGLTVLSSWGGNRKVGWVGEDSHVVFGQKLPGEKGSVRRCVLMMQQPTAIGRSLHTFSRSRSETTQ
jgi:hypothetical protein